MEKEELIIKLIQQDFKHLQLLLGIQKLGFDNDSNHFLGILDIVISLLGIEEEEEYPLQALKAYGIQSNSFLCIYAICYGTCFVITEFQVLKFVYLDPDKDE
ncbi:hypothetical protein Belba_3655 [Belliella baltica DSM 15883]|uniref:Uncharacterized protein n=1 Tax=Belliella baltica (strain DSM 15883 / CIP 108006 / LMG 21964 / BA134) TaxID=866536 RepID=I3ZA78_BELBD|nr:hypothetical protein [Belliella baltica]AFL86146.1 hypothetical protein Belba_3655 [Belliella baltica DSM 15883]